MYTCPKSIQSQNDIHHLIQNDIQNPTSSKLQCCPRGCSWNGFKSCSCAPVLPRSETFHRGPSGGCCKKLNSRDNQQHYRNRISSVTHEYLNERGTSRVTSKVRAYRRLNKTDNKSRVECMNASLYVFVIRPHEYSYPSPVITLHLALVVHTYSTIKTQCSRRRQDPRQSPHHFKIPENIFLYAVLHSELVQGVPNATLGPKTATYTNQSMHAKQYITPETQNQIKVNCACYTYLKHTKLAGLTHLHIHISRCSSRGNPERNLTGQRTHIRHNYTSHSHG